ncbi:dihydroorotase [Desulfolutivibrio sulfoxidireducens]|uniref:dihydroorotase n=1 Tax=Desulfolutivibrio sulfoxidireducens TaxID=2773299 RepID=UPI00159E7CDB|nr:dihydroorotase [Desulfolutivibrio sulfoxidireducens]QLA14715.1 amidohydrolase family protein [Desulfolutivibrio sulfoxidireducens]
MAHPDLAVTNLIFPETPHPVDLLCAAGRIQGVIPHDPDAAYEGARVLSGRGLTLLPGLTDAHAHLREPGQEWKEDIASGLGAAAAGGFSNVMCMANTDPVNDTASVTEHMTTRAAATWPDGPRLFPIGALTRGLLGKELAPMAELARAGCVAFSNDGRPVADAELFRHAMEYASDLGLRVIDHCEEPTMAPGAGMNEGRVSSRLGLPGQPDVAEAIQVARDILLADYLGIPIHLAHISCRRSVELIERAKAKGVPVTAETCPHYLHFTEVEVEGYNTLAKVNPPLRTRDDVLALIQALREGVIDILATDHAPHAAHEKETPFGEAPCGISGLETALSLAFVLTDKGMLDVPDIIRLFATTPAHLFNLPINTFNSGDPADFVLFDPREAWTVTPDSLFSKGKNTPCLGRTLTGRVVAHFIGATPVFTRGEFTSAATASASRSTHGRHS